MSDRPILVLGYGNPSRGDDALAPELLNRLVARQSNGEFSDTVEVVTDFQLQVEHTLDLKGRERVLFIDASYGSEPPFSFSRLRPLEDASHTTHALSPRALLAAFEKTWNQPAPPSWLLEIPGYEFNLGESISEKAENNLASALVFVSRLLNTDLTESWDKTDLTTRE